MLEELKPILLGYRKEVEAWILDLLLDATTYTVEREFENGMLCWHNCIISIESADGMIWRLTDEEVDDFHTSGIAAKFDAWINNEIPDSDRKTFTIGDF